MKNRLRLLPLDSTKQCEFYNKRLVLHGLIEMDAEASKTFFYDPIKRDGKEYGKFSVWYNQDVKLFQELIEEQREKIFRGNMSTIPYRVKKRVTDFFGESCSHHFDRVSKTSISGLDLEFGRDELPTELLERSIPLGECELFWTTQSAKKEIQELLLLDELMEWEENISKKFEETCELMEVSTPCAERPYRVMFCGSDDTCYDVALESQERVCEFLSQMHSFDFVVANMVM